VPFTFEEAMAETAPQAAERFAMLCYRCERPVIAHRGWAGWEVRCPHCQSVMRVPPPPDDGRPVRAEPPDVSAKRCFNFACPRCDCLLEAHTGMSGQPGTCPTCAARFKIPYIKGRSGMPQKAVLIEGEAEAPLPLHAYAASGHQAPLIVQREDGTAVIQCPHCNAHNTIDADACEACGTPFTMETAPTVGKLRRDRQATAALAFGVVAFFLFFAIVPGLLAIWFGVRSVMFAGSSRLCVRGLTGLALGLLSLAGAAAFWYYKLK
jgi:ribosomal protein L40E